MRRFVNESNHSELNSGFRAPSPMARPPMAALPLHNYSSIPATVPPYTTLIPTTTPPPSSSRSSISSSMSTLSMLQLPPAGSSIKQSHAHVAMQPHNSASRSSNARASDYTVQQSTGPQLQAAVSRKVQMPSPQSAHSPTVISIQQQPRQTTADQRQPTSIIRARLDHSQVGSTVRIAVDSQQLADGRRSNNYRLETTNPDTGDMVLVMGNGGPINGFGDPRIHLPPMNHHNHHGPVGTVQSILVDPDHPSPAYVNYVDQLCKRTMNVLSSPSPVGQRDSVASSTGSDSFYTGQAPPSVSPSVHSSSSKTPLYQSERSFQQIMRQTAAGRSSPSSMSMSTTSSAESGRQLPHLSQHQPTQQAYQPPPHEEEEDTSVVRCVSPLPDSIAFRLERGQYEQMVKPCKSQMFCFFMEQHVERLIQQYHDRVDRLMQVSSSSCDPSAPPKPIIAHHK